MSVPGIWVLRHALRDTRGVRGQLFVFLLSMVLGVAALVAINSIGENLTSAVDDQAKALLGADFRLESNAAFTPEAEAVIDSLGGRQARLYSFASMALAPSSGRTRLVAVRAADQGYPFYGDFVTDPPEAATAYLQSSGTIVDPTVLTQLSLSIGDTLRVGRRGYRVEGSIIQTSRETSAMSAISPRVYVPRAELDSLLLAFGSRVDYEVYFRFDDGRDVEQMSVDLRQRFRALGMRFSTVEKEKREWNEALTNLYRFLALVAFVALLLGGLGVASSMHVYIRRRMASVAVLRCIGATPSDTAAIYFLQALALGFVGSVLGAIVGVAIQQLVPVLINAASPLQIVPILSPKSIGLGIVIGTTISVLFALYPVLGVGSVSPLSVLRSDVSESGRSRRTARVLLTIASISGLGLVAAWQAPTPIMGAVYVVGLLVVFTLLRAVGWLLSKAARGVRLLKLPFEIRQGIAAMFRPGNQTALLTVTIGFIAFMVFLLSGLRDTLLKQVSLSGEDGRPNLILFDIQPDQIAGVSKLVSESGYAVVESVPIVSMRITAINGKSIRELRDDDQTRTGWAHSREYRSSFRDELNPSEKLSEGELGRPFTLAFDVTRDVARITMASDLEDELNVGIGDTLEFDVQGLSIRTVIAGIREIDWGQLRTNFYFLFPTGVLEGAPATHVVVAHIPEPTQMSQVQADVVNAYPNVSAIDLSLILSVVESVFDKIATVIRFLALFCVGTGILVLIGSITSGQSIRTEESVLLKTLGASQSTVQMILATEYATIGLIATLSGLGLGATAVWLLSRFSFKIPARFPLGEYAVFIIVIVGITVIVGMLLSRSVYKQSPLVVLRNEM